MIAGILSIASVTLPVLLLAQSPPPAGRMEFAPARTVAALDMGRLKGQPSRLAWSPDGSQLYVQTVEGWFPEPKAVRHYVLAASGGAPESVQAEPEWLGPYWTAKSGQASPDFPEVKIALETEQKREQTTSVPRGGDLARGGTSVATGTSSDDATAAAYNSQMIAIHSMKLHGQTIGRFVNTVIVPGLTFGWGPKGSQVIAYAAQDGKVVVMDREGTRRDLDGSKDAVLPAWSPDGTELAWLQKDGRRNYVVRVARLR